MRTDLDEATQGGVVLQQRRVARNQQYGLACICQLVAQMRSQILLLWVRHCKEGGGREGA